MITFKDYPLSSALHKALEKLGFNEPTEIQQRALEKLLDKNPVDFHGQAQTGTGKTLAFGLPLIEKINTSVRATQALIVAPTRELVLQICESLQAVSTHSGVSIESIYGGMPIEPQTRVLRRGVHIVVGTPGRLNDHLRRGNLQLKELAVLVLDEADIMLDMGFKEEIDEILSFAPKKRQIWLFSATVKSGIQDIKNAHMRNPVTVSVSGKQVTTASTQQFYCVVPRKYKLEALCRFLDMAQDFYGVVFCQTKLMASEVASKLSKAGYAVGALHGDMSQALRNRVIKSFKEGSYKVLIATDVAARGIDVNGLTHVINYSFPEDEESYVHRIGRTGRAGKQGTAITFVERTQLRRVSRLAKRFQATIAPLNVPTLDEVMKMRIGHLAATVEELCAKKAPESGAMRSLHDLIAQRSQADLVNGLYALLCQNVLKGYEEASEIEFSPSEQTSSDEHQELAISLGKEDGITKQDIIRYLADAHVITARDIQKIRIIQRRSFVFVPASRASQLLDGLRGKSIKGKKTRVMYA